MIMKIKKSLSITALLLCLSLSVQAAWYRSTGSAAIVDGDSDFAREQAVKDALKEAMLAAGASITSIQRLNNGSLVRDDFQIKSSSEIRQYQIIEEETKNQRLYVKIRAFIVPEKSSACVGSQYAKSVTMVRFNWQNKDDAKYGQIYELNRILTKSLYDRLGQKRRSLLMHAWLDNNLDLYPGLISQNEQRLTDQIRDISSQTDSQYIVLGTITDASLETAQPSLTDNVIPKNLFNDPIRHFKLQLFLYNGITGQLLEKPFYQTRALWGFDDTTIVDPNSQTFWQSAYGGEIDAKLKQVTEEVRERLLCELPTAKIIYIDGSNYHINLGRANGVKIGDQFHILHKADFNDGTGKYHVLRNQAQSTMEVKEVFDENAVLRPTAQYVAGNIQLGDIAELSHD